MRRVAFILLLILAGCQKDFDSQYAETERKVKAAEAKIDLVIFPELTVTG
jgi:predicted amidohydrolase